MEKIHKGRKGNAQHHQSLFLTTVMLCYIRLENFTTSVYTLNSKLYQEITEKKDQSYEMLSEMINKALQKHTPITTRRKIFN